MSQYILVVYSDSTKFYLQDTETYGDCYKLLLSLTENYQLNSMLLTRGDFRLELNLNKLENNFLFSYGRFIDIIDEINGYLTESQREYVASFYSSVDMFQAFLMGFGYALIYHALYYYTESLNEIQLMGTFENSFNKYNFNTIKTTRLLLTQDPVLNNVIRGYHSFCNVWGDFFVEYQQREDRNCNDNVVINDLYLRLDNLTTIVNTLEERLDKLETTKFTNCYEELKLELDKLKEQLLKYTELLKVIAMKDKQ